MKYEEKDNIKYNINGFSKHTKLNENNISKVKSLLEKNEHKQNMPPICKLK